MANVTKGFSSYPEEFLEESRKFQALEKRLISEATILEGAVYYHYNADGSFAGLSQTEPLPATKKERAAERERRRLLALQQNGDTATANTTTNGGTETANILTNEPPALKKNIANPPPITTNPPTKSKVPPIIINHNESGSIIMGAEGKKARVSRPRDIGLYASEGDDHIKLFRDGGFELKSSKNFVAGVSEAGSNIIQNCIGVPLHIISKGDIRVSCAGTFSIDANRIVMKSNASNEVGINIDAESDIRIDAGKDFLVTADNITHDAKERVLSHSEGWTILIGQSIRLHEPQTNMCPAFMNEYIDKQIKNLRV